MISVLLACQSPQDTPEAAQTEQITDIVAAQGEVVPSILTVTFATADTAQAWVEYSTDGADVRSTLRSAPGTDHSLTVLGLPPLSEATLQIVAEIDGERHTSGTFSAQTGQVLPGTPVLDVTVSSYDGPPDATLLMSVFGEPSFIVMAGLDGVVHWSLEIEGEGPRGVGLVPVIEEGRLYYSTFEAGGWKSGGLAALDMRGQITERIDAPAAHHFFTRLPDGALLWLENDIREVDGLGMVVGDQVVRRDPDGSQTILLSLWDHLEVYPSRTWDSGFYTEGLDWTHANWLSHVAERDAVLLSTAGTDTLFEFDLDGTLRSQFGGEQSAGSDTVFEPPDATFGFPHGPHWDGDELLMLSTVEGRSEAIGFAVDGSTLSQTWSFGADQEHEVQFLGEVQPLPDGNRLVSWGSKGIIQVVSEEGEVLWEAHTAAEQLPCQIHLLASPYADWR